MPNLIPPKIPDGEKVDFDVGNKQAKQFCTSLHMSKPRHAYRSVSFEMSIDVLLKYMLVN